MPIPTFRELEQLASLKKSWRQYYFAEIARLLDQKDDGIPERITFVEGQAFSGSSSDTPGSVVFLTGYLLK